MPLSGFVINRKNPAKQLILIANIFKTTSVADPDLHVRGGGGGGGRGWGRF